MKKLRVLFVSKKTPQAEKLFEDLSKKPEFETTFMDTAQESMARIVHGGMDCVIFNFESFGRNQLKLVQEIKDIGKIFQILIFAESAEKEITKEIKGAQQIILVELPLVNPGKDIVGLCSRLIGGEEIYQRESKRFPTKQSSEVTNKSNGLRFQAEILDISQNGVRIEAADSRISVGDELTLVIFLDQIGVNRAISCEVRWVRPLPEGRVSAGLRFVKLEPVR